MLLKVIRVTQDGKTGYLLCADIYGDGETVVESPLEAKNYALPDNSASLEQDLQTLHLKGDAIFQKGSARVDTAEVVELEVTLQELSCTVGRLPRSAPP